MQKNQFVSRNFSVNHKLDLQSTCRNGKRRTELDRAHQGNHGNLTSRPSVTTFPLCTTTDQPKHYHKRSDASIFGRLAVGKSDSVKFRHFAGWVVLEFRKNSLDFACNKDSFMFIIHAHSWVPDPHTRITKRPPLRIVCCPES